MTAAVLYAFPVLGTLSLEQLLFVFVGFIVIVIVLAFLHQPKRFYIVRHGQTLLNQTETKQGPDGALSDKGIEQARMLGAALAPLKIQRIITSPYERARQTADLINETLHGRLSITPLLAERRNASEVIGRPVDDPLVKRVMGMTEYGHHADEYRYADEENFIDLRKRAKKCLTYLEHRPGTMFLVVTHHAFMQMLLSYLLYRRRLHAKDYVNLAFLNPAGNAGVTICEYHPLHSPFDPTHGWRVIAYNERFDTAP